MFDTKNLRATPANARRLLKFAEFKNITSSPALVELAGKDLITRQSFDGSPITSEFLEDRALSTVQHILDWQGRGMILDLDDMVSRKATLAALWLKPKGKVVILTRPALYARWAALIKEVWPDQSVSVFGNPRYEEKSQIYPIGVQFKENPDVDADWMITSYGSLIWNEVANRVTIGQMIVEELDGKDSMNYRWDEAVRGLITEIPNVLFIQNVRSAAPNSATHVGDLQSSQSTLSLHIQHIIREYLWPYNVGIARMPRYADETPVIKYLAERKYRNVNFFNLLPVMGVDTSLLEAPNQTISLNYFDTSVSNLRKAKAEGRNKESALYRMVKRETGLEAHTGVSIEAMVRDCLDGSDTHIEHLRGLQTVQWANTKAQFIKSTLDLIMTRMVKGLLVSESAELARSIKLSMAGRVEEYSSRSKGGDPATTMARFLYPTGDYQKFNSNVNSSLHGLVIDQSTVDSEEAIDYASYLVICDPIMSRSTYEFYCELAKARDLRLVQCVMLGTFEEEFFKQLNK